MIKRIALLAALAIAGSPAIASAVPTNRIDDLVLRVDTLLTEHGIPGAALALVSRDSILWMGGVGVSSRESGDPVTENTVFRVASISKSFTALAVLALAERGRVDLDTPVRHLAPEVEIDNPWESSDPVRLVHLLEHTSGIDDAHFNEVYNLSGEPGMPLRDVLAINPGSRRVRSRPGSRVVYSNDGYAVVGHVIENVTGEPFETVAGRTILGPVGMTASSFQFVGGGPGVAQGHLPGGEPFPARPLYLRPASSLTSSALDMARFVRFLLNRGRVDATRVLEESTIARMETPVSGPAARAGWTMGYGAGNRQRYLAGATWFGHGGGFPGFRALYAYERSRGVGFVVLVNSSNADGFWPIVRHVAAFLLDGQDSPASPAPSVTAAELERYAGYYEYRSSGTRLDAMLNVLLAGANFRVENGALVRADFMSTPKRLIPVATNSFREANDPGARVMFLQDEAGVPTMVEMGADHYVRSAAWKPVVGRALLLGAVVIMLTVIPHVLVWLPRAVFRRARGRRPLSAMRVRVAPLLALASLLLAVAAVRAWSADPLRAGELTPSSVGFCVSTALFAVFSVVSLAFAVWSYRQPVGRASRIYATVVSLACVGTAAYLAYWGIIGIRLWAY